MKSIVLYQTSKRGPYLAAASVYPGTKDGITAAMKAVGKEVRAIIFTILDVPTGSKELLNLCAVRAAGSEYKVLQP